MKEILDFLGDSTGINIAYDKDFPPNAVDQRQHRRRHARRGAAADPDRQRRVLQGAEPAQHHRHRGQPRPSAACTTSRPSRRSTCRAPTPAEIEQLLTKVVAAQQTGVRPTFAANKAGNSITVRGTVPMLQMIERIIAMNDKPRAEISVDVEILEVNRGNAQAVRPRPVVLAARPGVLARDPGPTPTRRRASST